MTNPRIIESRLFFKLILCIRLLITGYLLEISLNLVCKRLNACRWLVKCSLVSIAIAICSLTKRSELQQNLNTRIDDPETHLCMCWFSFKYISRRLLIPSLRKVSPEPLNKSSLSLRTSCWEVVFRKSRDRSVKISRWRWRVWSMAAPETGCSDIRSLTWVNCREFCRFLTIVYKIKYSSMF